MYVYICEIRVHWLQGLYRLGVAFQGLEEYEAAMVSYADGLVADPKQGSMLHGLIEVMLKSPHRGMYVYMCVCMYV